MRYLLDTHTFLWFAAEPNKLPETLRTLLSDTNNDLLLSAASAWEIALLWQLQKITLPEPPQFFIPQAILALSLTPLDIDFEMAITAATLPLLHRDPFDRLLVAATIQENVVLLSKDQILPKYGVAVMWD
jgi:PIN domain nuclease of toxin-antitoxin system